VTTRQHAALAGVIVVGVATALGVDLPKDEIAGMVTDLVTAVAGLVGIVVAAGRDPSGTGSRPPPPTTTPPEGGSPPWHPGGDGRS